MKAATCAQADDLVDSGSEDDDSGGRAAGSSRHAPGTWKVWEGPWFCAARTPGYTDVKIIMKQAFRNVTTGLGLTMMSKTLSPHHYGETWEKPEGTLLLLRSWAFWRARWCGWSKAKECREREVQRQVERLTAEIGRLHGARPARPLLGSAAADLLLSKWVPDVVGRLAP